MKHHGILHISKYYITYTLNMNKSSNNNPITYAFQFQFIAQLNHSITILYATISYYNSNSSQHAS